MILNALARKPLPVYGDGTNVRDWIHVEDHCDAISLALEKGVPGRTYAVGGRAELPNIDIVLTICASLDALKPHPDGPYADLVRFVADRPGHDFR
jgi:dTDP-glucose 4,6-dehydratase